MDSLTLSWALASFLGGLFVGGWLALRLTSVRGLPASKPGYSWARADYRAPEPPESFVRKIAMLRDDPVHDGRALTFHVQDAGLLERDLTYRASQVLKFFQSGDAGPRRSGYRGDHGDYSKLLAIAQHYQWLIHDGSAFQWAPAFGTRERRLRALKGWLSS